MVLEAPTGIGKTKIFLDIVNRCSKQMKIKRVFYFSPLLALTEDFEGKIFNEKNKDNAIVKLEDAEKGLV
jgi:CRISPR/Cas system-associated endonuclease/helicase Cas3